MHITKSNKPLVSIIIICFNGEDTLAEAIDSAIAQTWSNTEIIVVDDGSSDNSRAIARSYGDKIVLVEKANGGIASARNAGFNASSGEFISWLDSDDRIVPEKTELQMSLLFEKPELVAIASDFLAFDENGTFSESFIEEYYSAFNEVQESVSAQITESLGNTKVYIGDFSNIILSGNFLHPGTLIIRRHAFEAVGLQKEKMGSAADFEFVIRLLQYGPAAIIMKALQEYRISEFQDSSPKNMARNLGFVVTCLEEFENENSPLNNIRQGIVERHLISLYSDLSRELGDTNKKEAFRYWIKAVKLKGLNRTLMIAIAKLITPTFLLNLKRKLS